MFGIGGLGGGGGMGLGMLEQLLKPLMDMIMKAVQGGGDKGGGGSPVNMPWQNPFQNSTFDHRSAHNPEALGARKMELAKNDLDPSQIDQSQQFAQNRPVDGTNQVASVQNEAKFQMPPSAIKV